VLGEAVEDEVPELPDKLCSSACTIEFMKLELPTPPALPLPSLSPSESPPETRWFELDVGCKYDKLLVLATLLIELIGFSKDM